MKSISTLALTVALALSSVTITPANAAQHAAESTQSAAAAAMSEGEIKKVDKDAAKITIKHGELKNLDMPPMTMVFRVKDPVMLDRVKAGDKISFIAEKLNGQFTVTQVEVKK